MTLIRPAPCPLLLPPARLIPTALLWLLSAAALPAQSSVWKVTSGSSVVYLGGTCHVLRPSDFPLPVEFDTAFAASARIYFETDVERMLSDELQDVIATQGMYTDGRTLPGVLTPEVWKAVQAYAAKSGVAAGRLRRTKPWLLVILMAGIEMEKLGISQEGVDLHYFHRTAGARKRTGRLESFEDHIAFLTRLGTGRESEMIARTLEDLDEVPTRLPRILAAWRAGDLAVLDELLLHDMRTKYPAIFQDLLASRNLAWLPRIEDMFKTPEVEFVLAGVGHMPGPEGLLALLRDRGYTIEQIKAPPPVKKAKR